MSQLIEEDVQNESPRPDFKFLPGMNQTSTPKTYTTPEESPDQNMNVNMNGNENISVNENNNGVTPQRSSAATEKRRQSTSSASAPFNRFPSIEKRRNSNVFPAPELSPPIINTKPLTRRASVEKYTNSQGGAGTSGVKSQDFFPDLHVSPASTPPPPLPSVPPPSFSIGASALNFNVNTNGHVDENFVPRHRHSHSSSSISAPNQDESLECFPDHVQPGLFHSASEHTSLQYRDASDLSVPDISGIGGSGLSFKRNTVHRTSLRKSPQHNADSMGHRRWGSFRNPSGVKRPQVPVTSSSALATQLYRSSSFHSSGPSSGGDGEEMYSDGSLEDEVIDLTQKVHHLEEKFSVLAENQSDVDDRYTRAKQENAEISTKLFMVEEQLRDSEQRAEEKLREEQRRFKETLSRLEREKQLQIENCGIRLQSLERDLELSKSESSRLKQQLERERTNHELQGDKLIETERELSNLRDDHRNLLDQSRKDRENLVLETSGSQQALIDLKKEVESLRCFQMANSPNNTLNHRGSIDGGEAGELKSRLIELEEENKRLKQQNKELQDANDELTAQLLNQGLEEGLHLLTLNNAGIGNSLAAEFEAMSQDQSPKSDGEKPGFGDIFGTDLSKVKSALKEQKEVNDQLRTYIDGILLNIVENYPQLLEVKNKCISPKF